MCCSSARAQRLVVEECLKYIDFVLLYYPSDGELQVGDSAEGLREAVDLASCYSLQARWHDSTRGKCAELAGEHNISDVSHGKNSVFFSLLYRISINAILDV